MAVLTLTTHSRELKMNTLLTAIIPDSSNMDNPLSERKVLWLLHGLSDNATAWLRWTRVENYAQRYGIVVIMPSCDRSFYFDNVNGMNYFTYLTEELPEYLEKVFALSRKKEDNFIAGLSMGGYGAVKAALTHPDRYFACGSFSGVLAFEIFAHSDISEFEKEFPFMTEDFPSLLASENNPPNLLSPEKDVKLYVSCGLQDYLLPATKIFEERARERNVKGKFVYRDGYHDWDFWEVEIKNFLSYLFE